MHISRKCSWCGCDRVYPNHDDFMEHVVKCKAQHLKESPVPSADEMEERNVIEAMDAKKAAKASRGRRAKARGRRDGEPPQGVGGGEPPQGVGDGEPAQ